MVLECSLCSWFVPRGYLVWFVLRGTFLLLHLLLPGSVFWLFVCLAFGSILCNCDKNMSESSSSNKLFLDLSHLRFFKILSQPMKYGIHIMYISATTLLLKYWKISQRLATKVKEQKYYWQNVLKLSKVKVLACIKMFMVTDLLLCMTPSTSHKINVGGGEMINRVGRKTKQSFALLICIPNLCFFVKI